MRKQLDSGFTLVEFLVVLTIVGLLAALLVPAVQSVRQKESNRGSAAAQHVGNVISLEQSNGWHITLDCRGDQKYLLAKDDQVSKIRTALGSQKLVLVTCDGWSTITDVKYITDDGPVDIAVPVEAR